MDVYQLSPYETGPFAEPGATLIAIKRQIPVPTMLGLYLMGAHA